MIRVSIQKKAVAAADYASCDTRLAWDGSQTGGFYRSGYVNFSSGFYVGNGWNDQTSSVAWS